MITARTMKHVPNSRAIPTSRSCRATSRANQSVILDQGRMILSYARVLTKDAHRKWRNGLWQVWR